MKHDVDAVIAGNIRLLRRFHGLTMHDLGKMLAEGLGRPYSPQTMSWWEVNHRPCRVDELMALCKIFEVPLADMLSPMGIAVKHDPESLEWLEYVKGLDHDQP
jgi:transcriptional regulator with XRE-family HTH domain